MPSLVAGVNTILVAMASDSRVVLTQGVSQYRATVPHLVGPSDSVLEVGCATGKTTKIIAAHAAWVLAIDQSSKVLEARELGLRNARFERWNAWDIDTIRSVATRFDRIYVDISGSGSVEAVIRLVRSYENAFGPQVVVVKNSRLKAFVSSCHVWGDESAKASMRSGPSSQELFLDSSG